MPQLSVIIPVYESQPYLDKCLTSLCNQTFRDMEIICINDGSTDGSLEILRRFESMDDRIKVIDQENAGPAIARNVGLDIATGEYIGFLDSDDYIAPDYFESMMAMVRKHDVDILLNNHVMREEQKGSHLYRGSYYSKQLPEGEFLDKNFAADNTVCLLYAHLYRGSLIQDNAVRFQARKFDHSDDYFHEDEYFHRIAHYYADRVFAYSGPEYHYVARPGSIMATRKRKNIAYIRCFSALKAYFGDRIYDKTFRLKLFSPMLYSEISDTEEFTTVRDYLISLDEYVAKSGVFLSDFDHFAMDAIRSSSTVEECNAKLGRYPFFRYQTRNRLKARNNVAVSVIIPVYNTQKDLVHCLESVCSQTLRDIEVICVNDCSTDGSLDVMKSFANEDFRVKVVDLPQNGGVSKARNAGLDAACGKYIFFIDSDDWIDSTHLEELVARIEECGKDVVTNVNYVMEHVDTGKQAYSCFDWASEETSVLPAGKVQRLFPPVIWASIYNRSFIESAKLRFPDVPYGAEDVFFSGACYLLAGSVAVFKGTPYHYLQRPGSLVRSKGRGFQYLRSFRMMRDLALQKGASIEDAKLFYVESLFIEDEEMFLFTKDFMSEIKEDVEKHPEFYTDQDRFLMDIAINTPDYQTFKAKYNPNISMSFIRSRMKAR